MTSEKKAFLWTVGILIGWPLTAFLSSFVNTILPAIIMFAPLAILPVILVFAGIYEGLRVYFESRDKKRFFNKF